MTDIESSAGRLAWRAKVGFARRAVVAQLAGMPSVVRAALGGAHNRPGITVAAAPPDSRLARQATDLAEEIYGEQLLAHCVRCWYFGDVFAQLGNLRYDPELFYIACLLHDAGLTDRFRPPAEAACFAVHGGAAARDTLTGWGAEQRFADTVADAIAVHMDVRVPVDSGVEAHLLHAGAHLDVAGVRCGDVPREVLAEILRRCPRADFATVFLSAMRREARERPDSRAAVMWKQGMALPVKTNPLNRILTE
ncbi:cyanamide hydratase [Nocardia veterana]|nr:cyanamide hydratase [Nocardia veterana]